jgi:hypothetical protein
VDAYRIRLDTAIDVFRAAGFSMSDMSVLLVDRVGIEDPLEFGPVNVASPRLTLAIPEIGRLLAIGRIVSTISNVDACLAGARPVCALLTCGICAHHVSHYLELIRRGSLLFSVYCDN